MPPTARSPRQDRSIATRERILRATLACLNKRGYAGTTTTAVEQQARISRGALLYHFPTRASLVSAAVARLFEDLRADFQRGFAALAREGDRVAAALELLWETFQDPRLAAVLELYVAGRTDRELRNQLRPVATEHQAHVIGLAHSFFPEVATDGRFSAVLHLVLDTLQGMAVRRLSQPDDPSVDRTLALLKELAAAATAPER